MFYSDEQLRAMYPDGRGKRIIRFPDRHAPVAEFAAIAARYPVFRVKPAAV